MKTIQVYAPNPTDATSFYRAIGPFQELKKKHGYALQMSRDTNWAVLKGVDVAFIQRPFTDQHVQIVEMCRANGVPVWVDYDDDLYSVPKNNRSHKMYSSQKVQNNISRIITMADKISVSTGYLKSRFTAILAEIKKIHDEKEVKSLYNLNGDKVRVIENAYDWNFVKKYRSQGLLQPKPNKLILWRGSDTHDKDLFLYTEAMAAALEASPDWTWLFVGNPFWHTIERLKSCPSAKPTSVLEIDSLDPADYWKEIYNVSPSLVIVPLEENEFNLSKSNIAWIEANHAGAVCLAPDWEEWRRPGVINYRDPEDFEKKLKDYMAGKYDWETNLKAGMEYIGENLLLSEINIKRQMILEELFGD